METVNNGSGAATSAAANSPINTVIIGYNGYMGRVLEALVINDPAMRLIAGVDITTNSSGNCPVYSSIDNFPDKADVIIDFSNSSSLSSLLKYGCENSTPLVLCTTGYSPEQLDAINSAGEHIAVFRSGNMSVGINLLAELIKRACAVLGESFDIEIVESHHRRKVDAPSGTAIMLADAAASTLPYKPEYIYERQSLRAQRDSSHIGISSIRGGTIVGEHDVIFAGQDEVITLKHSAASRDVFAAGALRAAKFIVSIGKPGVYNMDNLLSSII